MSHKYELTPLGFVDWSRNTTGTGTSTCTCTPLFTVLRPPNINPHFFGLLGVLAYSILTKIQKAQIYYVTHKQNKSSVTKWVSKAIGRRSTVVLVLCSGGIICLLPFLHTTNCRGFIKDLQSSPFCFGPNLY